MTAKFSHCDQINLNELLLKPGSPEQKHIANQLLFIDLNNLQLKKKKLLYVGNYT